MKVLFANPPTFINKDSFFRPVRFPTFNYATPVMHPPIYLAYAAGLIRSLGHDIVFIDAPVHGIAVCDFVDEVVRVCPQYVVFETSTPSLDNDARVAALIKENLPLVRIVFCGPHVTALPQESLERHKSIDAVVMGEYEFSLAEYVAKGPEKTKGIAYRSAQGQVIINERRPFEANLDQIPFPARDLLDNYRYVDPILKNPFTFVVSGRGCPHLCTFCSWPEHLTGRKHRRRSVNNIVDEIESIQKTYEFKSFLFNDDTFTAHKEHVCAVTAQMRQRKISIPWGCYARADADDDELLKSLREAGCFLLKIGVESGDETILRGVQKPYDLSRVKRAVKKMLSYGFHVHATFAFGLPGETQETIEKTIRFAQKLNATTVQFSIAVPYPGTVFFKELQSNKYLLTENWNDYMPLKPIYSYPHLSYDEMHAALRRAYRRYYFRPKYMLVGLHQAMTQPHVFWGNLKKLIGLVLGKR